MVTDSRKCKPTANFCSVLILRLRTMVRLRNAHLFQRPQPHHVQLPLRMAPLRPLQAKLQVRAHSHALTQRVTSLLFHLWLTALCAWLCDMNIVVTDSISGPLWLDPSVAIALWLELSTVAGKMQPATTPGNKQTELLPYVALYQIQELAFETPDWYFYHITNSISPPCMRELWLSLSC